MALTNVSKRDAQRELGLGVELDFLGITKEDIVVSKGDKAVQLTVSVARNLRVDYSNIEEAVPELPPVRVEEMAKSSTPNDTLKRQAQEAAEKKGAPQSSELAVLRLTRDGNLVKFTELFSDRPAYGHGRYRSRKLRIKRKKGAARLQPIFCEDQTELFHKSLPNKPIPSKPSLYSQILLSVRGASKRNRASSRLRQIEQMLENSTLSSDPRMDRFVPNPGALLVESVKSLGCHPVDIVEWEESIIWDSIPNTGKRPTIAPLYAGIAAAPPPSSGQSSRPSLSFSRPTSPLQQPQYLSANHRFSSSMSGSNSRPQTPVTISAPRSIAGRIINTDFAHGSWDEQIIWDDDKLPDSLPPIHLFLNMNDPLLIFESLDMSSITEKLLKTEKLIQKRLKKLRHGVTSDGKSLVLQKFDKPVTDRFNLSNDKQYEPASKDQSTSSQSTGKTGSSQRVMVSSRIGVQHSVPALKLSLPFFKTFWNKTELRAWHRPRLDVSILINRPISFRPLKRTKDEAGRKSAASIINNAKKLSLRQVGEEFVLLEYTEEFPLLMMNTGMSTFLLQIYRKQQVKDTPEIESCFGIPRILEPNEASPFWFFGDVRPGQTLPAIQNNLFRAPLREHPSIQTDFLVLKFNIKGHTESEWYIRRLPSKIITVGQVLPTMEVFGPHSRKHNIFCRNRIQSFAYRLFGKDAQQLQQTGLEGRPRLKINRIMAAFPQFSEGSLRKWLKEYADSVRTGHDSGTWKLRSDAPNLNEDDLRALVTPEMICQYESMLAGQQRLNDAGFMDVPEMDGIEDETVIDSESAEVRLAPWNLSSNFISATAGKCTLELRGAGDPSGRGEAFSFVKAPLRMVVSSKLSSIPEVEVHKGLPPLSTLFSSHSCADVQANQSKPNAPTGPKLPAEQVAYRKEIVQIWDSQLKSLRSAPLEDEVAANTGLNQELSIFEESSTRRLESDEETASVTSRSSITKGAGRKLVISRIVRDPDTGKERIETEEIEDIRLLSAYMNQRRVWERKRRRREIAAAASAARAKKARPDGEASAPKIVKVRSAAPAKPKKEVFVRCGTCGQVGHMRTNRICPRYAEYEAEAKSLEGAHAGPQIDYSQVSTKISISRSVLEYAASAPVPPIKFKLPIPVPTIQTQVGARVDDYIMRSPSPLLQYIQKPKKEKRLESFSTEQRELVLQMAEKLGRTMESLLAVPDSWPFHRPVSKVDYPHYFKIVDRPLDLGTIRNRVKRYHYLNSASLLADIRLVRDNCVQFNGSDHVFSQTISKIFDLAVVLVSTSDISDLDARMEAIRSGNPTDHHHQPPSEDTELVVDDN